MECSWPNYGAAVRVAAAQAPKGQRGHKTEEGFEVRLASSVCRALMRSPTCDCSLYAHTVAFMCFDQTSKRVAVPAQITFGTNHFGPVYLTELLMPLVKKSAPARIVWVDSLGSQLVNPPIVGGDESGNGGIELIPWDDLKCAARHHCRQHKLRMCRFVPGAVLRPCYGVVCKKSSASPNWQSRSLCSTLFVASAHFMRLLRVHGRGAKAKDSDWWAYSRSKVSCMRPASLPAWAGPCAYTPSLPRSIACASRHAAAESNQGVAAAAVQHHDGQGGGAAPDGLRRGGVRRAPGPVHHRPLWQGALHRA